ncbi:MAG: S1C family serine protease, partial [Chloroflexi bacterium]|nr:S1C family serine protease [Chloroflexota bacterium]
MKKLLLVGLCLCLSGGLLVPAEAAARLNAPAVTDSIRQSIDLARERVYPALVNISVVVRYFSDGRAQRQPAGGSGVIVSKDGYVLTNFHVAGHT